MKRILLVLLATSALCAAGPAQAGVCDDLSWGISTGPVQAGLLEGELGSGHRACGRSEVGLSFGGLLLVDLPNFYGRLSADARFRGSWAATDRLELFGAFEFFRLDQLITPISVNAIGIGHTRIGASFRFVENDRAGLAVHGKVVLPTAVPLYQNTRPLAMDVGVAGQFAVHDRVQLHADLGMIHSFGLGKGPGQPRIGATVNFGAEFRPAWRFSLVADLHASFGYTEPLDVFAGALGFRFSDGKRFGFDLGATIPIAGRERAALRIDFAWTVRLGPITEAPADPKPGKKGAAGGSVDGG